MYTAHDAHKHTEARLKEMQTWTSQSYELQKEIATACDTGKHSVNTELKIGAYGLQRLRELCYKYTISEKYITISWEDANGCEKCFGGD